MNIHVLHENFRRFLLNENIDPNDVCMYHYGAGKAQQRIILYKPVPDESIAKRLFLDTVIIGAVLLEVLFDFSFPSSCPSACSTSLAVVRIIQRTMPLNVVAEVQHQTVLFV